MISFLGCKNQKEEILVGIVTELKLRNAPFSTWYVPNYENHIVNSKETNIIKPLLKDIEIKIFMGTWCKDSRQEVPKFYKIMDAMGYSKRNIELITMNRQKTTPENYENGLDIMNTPLPLFFTKMIKNSIVL